jgi:hypothetical protein
MKRWIKLLVTILLAVSIPLQGFASISMPTCGNMPMGANVLVTTSHANTMIDKVTAMSAACDMNVKNCCLLGGGKTCSNLKCSICHLSVFQLTSTGLLDMPDTLATEYQDLINQPYQNFPPTLFRPPKQIPA